MEWLIRPSRALLRPMRDGNNRTGTTHQSQQDREPCRAFHQYGSFLDKGAMLSVNARARYARSDDF